MSFDQWNSTSMPAPATGLPTVEETVRRSPPRLRAPLGRDPRPPGQGPAEGHKRSIEGISGLITPSRAAKPQDIRLRIKSLEFTPADIESITALDP